MSKRNNTMGLYKTVLPAIYHAGTPVKVRDVPTGSLFLHMIVDKADDAAGEIMMGLMGKHFSTSAHAHVVFVMDGMSVEDSLQAFRHTELVVILQAVPPVTVPGTSSHKLSGALLGKLRKLAKTGAVHCTTSELTKLSSLGLPMYSTGYLCGDPRGMHRIDLQGPTDVSQSYILMFLKSIGADKAPKRSAVKKPKWPFY